MDIMLPRWESACGAQIAPSTLGSIRNATVALIDDNYDETFTDEVELHLRESYGAIVKRLAKPNGSHPSPSSLIEEAAKCRVAVVGIGM